MAKNNFLSWDTVANSNSDVGGINIAEGCPPSNINNAIREVMAQLRADLDGGVVYSAKSGNYTAVANDNNGVIRFTANATLSLTAAATLGADWHVIIIADGGNVTIDPNASETINGATTIIIANGSSAEVFCNGSGFFTDKQLSNEQPFATIASATTTDLSTVGTQNVIITGTTTITSFGTLPAGVFRRLRFSSALTLTHNATSLILPNGGNDLSVLGGDVVNAISLGSGNWVVTDYQPATPASMQLQGLVNLSSTAVVLSSVIPTWVTRVTVMLGAVSLSGSAAVLVQMGSGAVDSAGYQANSLSIPDSVTPQGMSRVDGFPIFVASGSQTFSGQLVFTKMITSSNTWICHGACARSDAVVNILTAGRKSLSGALSLIRITTTNGTDTFDSGNAAISWE